MWSEGDAWKLGNQVQIMLDEFLDKTYLWDYVFNFVRKTWISRVLCIEISCPFHAMLAKHVNTYYMNVFQVSYDQYS